MIPLITGSELVPEARRDGDTVIASVRGDIDLNQSSELRTQVLDLLAKCAPKRLVLNLSQVSYMDSSAIAVLVETVQRLRKGGGRLVLIHLQPRVKSLVEIAKLDSIFTLAKDEADAMSK